MLNLDVGSLVSASFTKDFLKCDVWETRRCWEFFAWISSRAHVDDPTSSIFATSWTWTVLKGTFLLQRLRACALPTTLSIWVSSLCAFRRTSTQTLAQPAWTISPQPNNQSFNIYIVSVRGCSQLLSLAEHFAVPWHCLLFWRVAFRVIMLCFVSQ